MQPLPFKVFYDSLETFVQDNDGWDAIENGQLVKEGNGGDGAAGNQTRAQYGRYVMEGFEDLLQRLAAGGKRLGAFVDIGHGIGTTVMHAGLTRRVVARGIEIMEKRHHVAEQLLEGLKADLCHNMDFDSTLVELRRGDFTWAVEPSDTAGQEQHNVYGSRYEEFVEMDDSNRNINLRNYLLCADLPKEDRECMVIFVNNFNDIFGARSVKTGKPTLDVQLTELFANMEPGGRMVTLGDITQHLPPNASWYTREVMTSGENVVSWGSLPVDLFVLTKTSDRWRCPAPGCPTRQLPDCWIAAVDGNGRILMECPYCEKGSGRATRASTRGSTAAGGGGRGGGRGGGTGKREVDTDDDDDDDGGSKKLKKKRARR